MESSRTSSRKMESLKKFSGSLLEAVDVDVVADKSFSSLSPIDQKNLHSAFISKVPQAEYSAVTQCGNLVSTGCLSHIDTLIQLDIVPFLVNLLRPEYKHQMQANAAWTLANIAGGLSKHTKVVVGNDAVPLLVPLLSSDYYVAKMQAAWALGNIACDSLENRDIVFQNDALAPLLYLLKSENNNVLTVAQWTLEKLCRKDIPPRFNNQIPPVLPFLRGLFSMEDEHSRDVGALLTALRLLIFLDQSILYKDIAKADVYLQVAGFLFCDPKETQLPLYALMVMGNLAQYNGKAKKQILIDNGVLPAIKSLLKESEELVYKEEACWTIANIAAGTKAQLQAVIEEDLITLMIDFLKAEPLISKHAARAIFNASCGSFEQTRSLPCKECIQGLSDLMSSTDDPELLELCLNGLSNFLMDGETDMIKKNSTVNVYAQMVENHPEGFERLCSLENHDIKDISDSAEDIIDRYF